MGELLELLLDDDEYLMLVGLLEPVALVLTCCELFLTLVELTAFVLEPDLDFDTDTLFVLLVPFFVVDAFVEIRGVLVVALTLVFFKPF